MPHPNEALVRRAYQAQADGDIEGYLRLVSEDFVLHIPGKSRIAGDYVGRDELRRHFREIADLSGGTFRTTVHGVLANNDHVVGLLEASATRGDHVVLLPRVHTWHVRDGKLVELWVHPTDQYAFDAYWG